MTPADGTFRPLADGPRPSTITTPRLRLDPLQPGDADAMMTALDDERIHEFIGGEPLSLEQLRARYVRLAAGRSSDGAELWFNWIVRRVSGGAPIGTMQATVLADGTRADIAWIVGTAWQGHGFASEAAGAVVEWLAAAGVATVRALVHADHHASAAVAARAGLTRSGELVDGEVVWLRYLIPRI
jgi:RimJ/RimL family protein N-acetyltransferase